MGVIQMLRNYLHTCYLTVYNIVLPIVMCNLVSIKILINITIIIIIIMLINQGLARGQHARRRLINPHDGTDALKELTGSVQGRIVLRGNN